MQSTQQPETVRPAPRSNASQAPMILAATSAAIWALWLLQWAVVVVVFRHELFDSQSGGVQTIGPSAAHVTASILRHVGPLLISVGLLFVIWRGAGRRASWLAAILAFAGPIALILI
jgi:hypothetical protein